MAAFRLVQVSDTHLSREKPYFVENWDAVVAHLNAAPPDLVVNSGDIALNGPEVEDDLAFAAEQHARLDCPVRAIPGNHDSGDNPSHSDRPPKQPVTEARREAYRRHFGNERWAADAGDWRLIGINAQLFGTGLDAEATQWTFLADALADAGARPVALFLHKPLMKDDPGEAIAAAHRYVPAAARDRLLRAFGAARVRLVACGHVHQHRVLRHAGIDHVWCPSTAFVLPDDLQPRIGEKAVGFVEYRFDGDDVAIRVGRAEGMRDMLLTDVPAYGDVRRRMREQGLNTSAA